MNAISKKLLSMLVVVAMVLSMVPFGGLSVFAAETDETQVASSTVTPGQANLPEGIQSEIDEGDAIQTAAATALETNYCPVCKKTVEWKSLVSNKIPDNAETEASLHYVISGTVSSVNYNFNALTGSKTTLCVLLDNAAATINGRFRIAGTDNTLNIMGTGSITSDGSKCENLGLFTMNGTNPTLNLYGGNFTYTGTSLSGTAPIRAAINAVDPTNPTVNIYGSATIGKEAVDTTVANYNVYVAGGTVNMYGGTIRNGVTGVYGYSGNVGVAGGTTFNMYAGTVEGGQFLSGTGLTSPASVGGNVLVGCYTKSSTGSYTSAAANFNMYGGTVTGGKAYNNGNGGGNICTLNSGVVMQLLGGTISDGWARAYGGNVQHQSGTATIGGTVLITNGYAQNTGGGNLEVSANKTLTMSGGFITGGDKAKESTGNAKAGGAVYVRGTFNMTGGEIDGCKVSGNGGNIFAAGGATVTIGANATVKNGLTTTAANAGGGGNVYLAASTTAGSTMTTEGTITGGTVNGGSADSQSAGGNICVTANGANQSTLTVNGGTIADGTVTYTTKGSAFGGNIRSYNAKVIINDGLIYNGNAGSKSNGSIGVMGGTSTANTNATLEINGGIIVGGVAGCTVADGTETTNSAGDTTYTHTCSIKLTGSPKILNKYKVSDTVTSTAVGGYGLTVTAAVPLDISGLESGAEIWVTGNTLNMVFTEAYDGTEDLLSCFHHTASATRAVGLTDDKQQLKVIEYTEPVKTPVVGTFNPWECEGMAYCDACLAQGKTEAEALVEWTVYAGGNSNDDTALSGETTHYHLYLNADQTYSSDSFLWTYRKVCFNLNGHDVTAVAGASSAFGASSSSTLNLMDTEGGAVVTGYRNASTAGAALNVAGANAGATINIYGGTYTKLDSDTAAPIVQIAGHGGTINMYGGTIDATGKSVSNTMAGCAVTVVGGGEGEHATFNMEGGEIKGGTAPGGGSVMVGRYSTTIFDTATFNLKGGKISGGTATTAGGNFSVHYGGVLNISGGTLCNGSVVETATAGNNWGGNVRAYNGNVNISGGLIYGGTGGGQLAGANVSVYSDATGREAGRGKLHISGGTIVGDVAVSSGAADVLTLSGAPVIVTSMEIEGKTVTAINGGLAIQTNNKADISGLSAEADIALTADLNLVITEAHENAANVVGCFKHVNSAYTVALQTDDTLKVVEKVVEVPSLDKFEPEKFDGLAYCPVCYANGTHTEPVEWTVYAGENGSTALTGASGAHFHMYLKKDFTYETGCFMITYRNVCLNLNGHDITAVAGANSAFQIAAAASINFIDTEGGAVVTGYANNNNGAAIHVNGAEAKSGCNIYGGTFKKLAADTKSPVVLIGGNGGTINMHGGTIDASNTSTVDNATYNYGAAVALFGDSTKAYPAVLNMHDGEIIGGTGKNGGSVSLISAVASFEIKDGTISGGVATASGGNIYASGGNITISGGVITGGTAANDGGNICASAAKLTISGGTVSNGTAKGENTNNGYGGNIYAANTAVEMTDGTITGGKVLVNNNNRGGGNITLTGSSAVMDMSGGVIEKGVAGVEPATNKMTNAGNVLINTGSTLNMSGDAKIIDGTAGNQGGNIRVFKGDLIMSGDAVIKGGTAAQSANIWLVDADLIMSGNAQVLSAKGVTTVNGNAVNAAQYQIGSRIILSGNATVKGDETNNTRAINLTYNATLPNVLLIDNGWTGEAYLYATSDGTASYKSGDTISNATTGYCGALNTETATVTKGGSYEGKLYYHSTNTGIIGSNGDLIVSLLNVGDDWFASYDDALAAYYANGSFAKGEIFTVNSNATLTLNGDIYIESKGYTVTLDGTGNLYALDRANDDYVGYGTWNVSGSVKVVEDVTNPVNGNRYIVIKNTAGENKYSSHRIEVKLTAVTLRASEAGLYYKASYKCDGTLAGRVSAYGVAVSTNVTPGADFLEDYTNKIGFSCLENFDDVHETTGENAFTVNATSGSVFGIFKTAAERPDTADMTTAQLNAKYGKMKIYANTYFLVDTLADEDADNDYVVVSDTENGGTTNGIGFSLWDAMVAIDGMWNELTDSQKTMITEFYETWDGLVATKDQNAEYGWDLSAFSNILG